MGKKKEVRPAELKVLTAGNNKKTRSLQSLHERLRFTHKRPRTRITRGIGEPKSQVSAGSGYGYHATHSPPTLKPGKDAGMENGLIEMPPCFCVPLSASFFLESGALATTASSASCSSDITHMDVGSPLSSSESSPFSYSERNSDDGFSCEEEVVSLLCSADELGVLDFMPFTSEGHPGSMKSPGMWEELEKAQDEMSSVDEDDEDGEPYRIDLSDFEPDANDMKNLSHEQDARSNRGGVLCLRLDHEEVLRAWTESGGCLDTMTHLYHHHPSSSSHESHLLPFYRHTLFVPHPPNYFSPCLFYFS